MNVNEQTQPARIDQTAGPAPPAADVTVIVPVFNDRAGLQRCLAALEASTHERFDVIVVDDGSTEPIKPLVEGSGYRYLRIEGPGGPARARNRGVRETESRVVIFVDADVCVHADTVERFMRHFDGDPGLAAVVGAYDEAPGDPRFFSQYGNLFHYYTHSRSAGPITTFWSGCGAMRRDVFLEYGGFDEQRYRCPAIEDIELGTWVAAGGHRIVLDPATRCKHLKRWTFWGMLKTNLFCRGIPWVDLMLRSREAVKTLNVTGSQRLSVGLVFAVCAMLVLGIWWPWALVGAAASVVAVTLLNLDLYRFFASHRGVWFAAKSLPVHWLYFICCGLSVIVGTVRFYATRRGASDRPEKPDVPDDPPAGRSAAE